MNEKLREELQTEYYKLIELIYKYDDYLIRIKTGSISLGVIVTGIGIGIKSVYPLFLVILLAIAFWLTEASLKVVQLSNFKRITELENALNRGITENNFISPRIIQAYSECRKENEESGLWRKVIWWKHVMFPHIVFVLGSLIGILISIILKKKKKGITSRCSGRLTPPLTLLLSLRENTKSDRIILQQIQCS